MVVKKKIRIDLQSAGVPPIVHVMQNDEGVREVEVSLYNGGVEFVAENAIVTLAYKKPDGTSGWYDKLQDETPAISVDGNKVTATLAQQITSVAGNVFATIRIEDGLRRVSTFPFIVSVTADPTNGSVKSENYYNVTNWDDVNSSFDDVYEKLDELAKQCGGKSCVLYTEQTLTPEQQSQARENIGAADSGEVANLINIVTEEVVEYLEPEIQENAALKAGNIVTPAGANYYAVATFQVEPNGKYNISASVGFVNDKYAFFDKDGNLLIYEAGDPGNYAPFTIEVVAPENAAILKVNALTTIFGIPEVCHVQTVNNLQRASEEIADIRTAYDGTVYSTAGEAVRAQAKTTIRHTKQNLTPEQQAQARANIGAAAVGEGGGGSIAVTDDGNGNVTINSQAFTVTDDGKGNVSLN